MNERIKIEKKNNEDEEKKFPVPGGVLPLQQIVENTKILADAEEKRRLLEERAREFEKKIEAMFEEQDDGE